MGTFLFEQIIFGPVKSRRLGNSLGVNLLPVETKFCDFNCIYCECGFTDKFEMQDITLPEKEEVIQFLEQKLISLTSHNDYIDAITFAGNGEPTLHPEFESIINETIRLRDQYFPNARVAVLSNASKIGNPSVFKALNKADQSILKLDAGTDKTCRLINRPAENYDFDEVIYNLKRFKGNLIIQSLFFKGYYKGHYIDNSQPRELEKWLLLIDEIRPQMVMIYTFARDTAAADLQKLSYDELKKIAAKVEELNIQTQISG
jgi:wyosine [tRNA(Phe)-imidazoG37] synthetase (radical SAM superfamily)